MMEIGYPIVWEANVRDNSAFPDHKSRKSRGIGITEEVALFCRYFQV